MVDTVISSPGYHQIVQSPVGPVASIVPAQVPGMLGIDCKELIEFHHGAVAELNTGQPLLLSRVTAGKVVRTQPL